MGGFGSGRRSGRDVTADYRSLDVRELNRAGVLTPGWCGGWCWYRRSEKRAEIGIEVTEASVRLRYTLTTGGERNDHDDSVGLVRTPCHYGGFRVWFLCPSCARRVAILYGGAKFVCRHCRDLAYPVQRETDNDRVIRRADTIRKRLGWGAGILNPTGWKPKGMRWATFWRLWEEYHRLAGIGLEGIMESLKVAPRRQEDTQE